MSLPAGFDLDALLAPIPGDIPQGIDLREDYTARSPYSRLRDTRSEARDAEKQQEAPDPDAPGSPPEPGPLWRALRELAMQLLTQQTKDLEVAAWLTESLVRSDGLSGLAAGSRLMEGLVERYWDGIYPLPDEYGLETRVAPVTGLNGRSGGGSLMAPLFRVVLFRRADGKVVTLQDYQASARLASMDAVARQQRIAAGTAPFDDLEKDARAAGQSRTLTKLRDDAADALAAWEAMTAALDERAGSEAPSTSHIRDLVQEIGRVASRYAVEAPVDVPVQSVSATIVTGTDPEESASSPSQGMTRESALRTLETIATFFRRTEPHSPLSYTLDEAVRRARLPWLELLEEVLSDRTSRDALLTTLGIRPPLPPE